MAHVERHDLHAPDCGLGVGRYVPPSTWWPRCLTREERSRPALSVLVAAILKVLLVPPQSSRVDDEHRVDGRVHQALPRVFVAIMRFRGAERSTSLCPRSRSANEPDPAYRGGLWRARQDSNLRPSAPEADALSAELQARGRAPMRRREAGLYSLRAPLPRKRRSGSRRSRLECCPGEGSTGYPIVFCHVTRASITPAAPTTLTLPTHDPVTRAAASLARRPLLYPAEGHSAKSFWPSAY
jgi:hypothetical protein